MSVVGVTIPTITKRKENKMFSLNKDLILEVAVRFGSEYVSDNPGNAINMVNTWATMPQADKVAFIAGNPRMEGFNL